MRHNTSAVIRICDIFLKLIPEGFAHIPTRGAKHVSASARHTLTPLIHAVVSP